MSDTFDAGYGKLLETRLRVMTWNIWGRNGPWEARQPAVVATLRKVDADLIALQEVFDDGARSQADELAAALGFHAIFAPAFTFDGVQMGNAVLARWPIRRHEVRLLPREGGGVTDDEGEERLALLAEVDGPRGAVQLFCTHLSWRADHSGVRQEQVRAICRFVADTRPRTFPAILCGDLNADPASDEIRMLTGRGAVPVAGVIFRDAWESVNPDDTGHTWSNANPFARATLDVARRIDHILTTWPKAGGAGHCLAARIAGDEPVKGIHGSDHLGVVAELRY